MAAMHEFTSWMQPSIIEWDEARECNEQQTQKLRIWKRKRYVCYLQTIVEAKHAIG